MHFLNTFYLYFLCFWYFSNNYCKFVLLNPPTNCVFSAQSFMLLSDLKKKKKLEYIFANNSNYNNISLLCDGVSLKTFLKVFNFLYILYI